MQNRICLSQFSCREAKFIAFPPEIISICIWIYDDWSPSWISLVYLLRMYICPFKLQESSIRIYFFVCLSVCLSLIPVLHGLCLWSFTLLSSGAPGRWSLCSTFFLHPPAWGKIHPSASLPWLCRPDPHHWHRRPLLFTSQTSDPSTYQRSLHWLGLLPGTLFYLSIST